MRCIRLLFNKTEFFRISPLVYDKSWIISFLTGGLEDVIQFGGFHTHRDLAPLDFFLRGHLQKSHLQISYKSYD